MEIHQAIRLIFGAVCAALSVWTVVEAPTSWLWLTALGVTEWGHWLVAPSLLVWLPGWNKSWLGLTGVILGSVAALLFATPLIRAVVLTHSWPDGLPSLIGEAVPRSLPEALPRNAPLVPVDLFRGVESSDVPVRTMVYATRGDQSLAMDLYRPPGATQAPGVIVVHGGSWQHGDRAELAALSRYLAARGYVVASVSYRFAPQWPFPAARDDVRDAITFLKAHASEYGLDPRRLALLGRSAGGQIAL